MLCAGDVCLFVWNRVLRSPRCVDAEELEALKLRVRCLGNIRLYDNIQKCKVANARQQFTTVLIAFGEFWAVPH
ncbi:hypothetical protein M514_03972 [Trichuris suis]|uniref:Uncharacterized protein n=1 Tax=Trichuris suis TaxID=68888 RepID=A0A085MCV8_9BILA|nr:hypothetical protein M513_03972 [Trichuris suis]KFD72587.1 hypothetical protein M514_03972 [Trichuris suis]